MQFNKTRAVALTLALAAASAIGVAKLQQGFPDVPAGFWAEEAVRRVAAEGIILGNPDGTFQGRRNITRYEAAAMFDRLLRSNRFAQLTPETQTAVQNGMTEVRTALTQVQTDTKSNADKIAALETEIAAIRGAAPTTPATTTPTTTEPAAPAAPSAELDARIKAIEDEIAALKEASAAPATPTTPTEPATTTPAAPAPSQSDLDARFKALEDQIAALRTAAPAAPATGTPSADLEARVKALEDRPAAAAPATGAPSADLEARLKALEDRAAATPTAPAGAGQVLERIESQEARIAALETQVKDLTAQVDGIRNATPATPTTPTTTTPTTTTPDTTVTTPATPVDAPRSPRIYIGIGGALNALPFSNNYQNTLGGLGAFAQVGFNFGGNFGVRLQYDASELPTAGANLILGLGNGGFQPYLGVGGGAIFEGSTMNYFVGGVVGANLNFSSNLGLFVEAAPRYALSDGSFGVKTALGVRLFF
jgi:uncharacterized protein YceH (UPF0502 family)